MLALTQGMPGKQHMGWAVTRPNGWLPWGVLGVTALTALLVLSPGAACPEARAAASVPHTVSLFPPLPSSQQGGIQKHRPSPVPGSG